LGHLVDGLMTLARADGAKPAPEPADLHALVAARVDAWSDELTARDAVIESHVPEGLTVLTTVGALEQSLDNLISNALNAMPRGGRLTIAAGPANGVVELHVSDTGPGMTSEERSRALGRFWRARGSGSGSGLGLAIVDRLMTADGGAVDLRPASGGGLDVVLTLNRGGGSA
jgi:signal transduction histidine kinase